MYALIAFFDLTDTVLDFLNFLRRGIKIIALFEVSYPELTVTIIVTLFYQISKMVADFFIRRSMKHMNYLLCAHHK